MSTSPIGSHVSVVIPCRNSAATIGLQLRALTEQVSPPPFEILIVDNGSTDDLRSALDPFTAVETFHLRLISAGRHRGSSFARNAGIAHAKTPFVQFCDADDVVGANWVRHGLRSSQACELWSGVCLCLSEEIFDQPIAKIREHIDRDDRWLMPDWDDTRQYPVLMGGNFGGLKETLIRLGGFDQAASHYGDDNDLALRAQLAGVDIRHSRSTVLAYRGRFGLGDRLHRGFKETEARVQLLRRTPDSCLLPLKPWPEDLARALASTLRAPFSRGERFTLDAILLRWSWALGNTAGSLKKSSFSDEATATLGLGLNPADSEEIQL